MTKISEKHDCQHCSINPSECFDKCVGFKPKYKILVEKSESEVIGNLKQEKKEGYEFLKCEEIAENCTKKTNEAYYRKRTEENEKYMRNTRFWREQQKRCKYPDCKNAECACSFWFEQCLINKRKRESLFLYIFQRNYYFGGI